MLSPTRVAILSSIFSDIRPEKWPGVGSHFGANKGINTPFFEIVTAPSLFLTLNLVARIAEMNNWTGLVGLQETYASEAMVSLQTSVNRVSLLHLKPYGLNE